MPFFHTTVRRASTATAEPQETLAEFVTFVESEETNGKEVANRAFESLVLQKLPGVWVTCDTLPLEGAKLGDFDPAPDWREDGASAWIRWQS